MDTKGPRRNIWRPIFETIMLAMFERDVSGLNAAFEHSIAGMNAFRDSRQAPCHRQLNSAFGHEAGLTTCASHSSCFCSWRTWHLRWILRELSRNTATQFGQCRTASSRALPRRWFRPSTAICGSGRAAAWCALTACASYPLPRRRASNSFRTAF